MLHDESSGGLVSRAPRSEPLLETPPARPVLARSLRLPRPVDGPAAPPSPPLIVAPGLSEVDPSLRTFSVYALRITLEVLDCRRPPVHLRGYLRPPLIDAVRAVACAGAPGRGLGVARLRRVYVVQPVDAVSAEVFASYGRGRRVFAVAGHVQSVGRPAAWEVDTLQIA